jgi:FAD/FMN-containing dehydrogenase
MTVAWLTSETGNYHTVIVCPESQREKGEEVLTWVQQRAVQLEGTITGEHGIGLKLRERLVDEVGEEAIGMMRKVS